MFKTEHKCVDFLDKNRRHGTIVPISPADKEPHEQQDRQNRENTFCPEKTRGGEHQGPLKEPEGCGDDHPTGSSADLDPESGQGPSRRRHLHFRR